MKKKNWLILILLLIGGIGYGVVEAYIVPQMEEKQETYQEEQQDPITHDFESILKFKSKYMGDAGNFINLNGHLPLNDLERTYQMYPDELTAEIHFKAKASQVDQKLLKQALIYNSTANFVLIDNLEVLHFNFENMTYTLQRNMVEEWYGVSLAALQSPDVWKKEVQEKLTDEGYISEFMADNVNLN